MAETSLTELLERNARHVESLDSDHFAGVEDTQAPVAVSICCSDSRVPQDGMWDVTHPGWLFTPSTIGNQVWDIHDGERVVDGSLLYPMINTRTNVTLVVGHTGCGAVSAALDAVQNGPGMVPAGIEKWIDLIVPVVEAGLNDERIDADRDVSLVDQLVEYNVDRQIEFLLESDDVPETETVYGFVYDFQGVYSDERGRAYLVNADGETDVAALRELAPTKYHDAVDRLLQ